MKGTLTVLAVGLLVLPRFLPAAEHRIGFESGTAISQFHDLNHHQLRMAVPWKWHKTHPLQPESMQLGVGLLRRNGETIQTYSFGPLWRWPRPLAHCRCFIEAAVTVAYMNETGLYHPHNGLRQDFGSRIEFLSRVSVGFHFGRRRNWAIAFSVQHISNGGLGWTNPGADFVGAGIERRF